MSRRKDFTIRVPEDVDKALMDAAADADVSKSKWAERAIKRALIADGRLPPRCESQEAA